MLSDVLTTWFVEPGPRLGLADCHGCGGYGRDLGTGQLCSQCGGKGAFVSLAETPQSDELVSFLFR